MQSVLDRKTEIFLNFLYNCYNIPIRLIKETEKSLIYMGEIRCINGEIGIAKLEIKDKDRRIFTIYNKNRREIYQSVNINTEGRTKKILDRMVYGKGEGL